MNVKSLVKRNYKKQPEIDFPDYKSSIFRAPKNEKISITSNLEIFGPIFNKRIIDYLLCYIKTIVKMDYLLFWKKNF